MRIKIILSIIFLLLMISGCKMIDEPREIKQNLFYDNIMIPVSHSGYSGLPNCLNCHEVIMEDKRDN